VSLRRDIHSAFDVISPSLGGMPERVVQTVLADKRRRRNKEMSIRLRAPLSLVAALVAIALVAAVLVGGRILQDWNAFRGGSPAGTSYQTQVAHLEATPLHIPTFSDLTSCKSGPYNSAGDYGAGPVYGIGGATTSTAWGVYYNNTAWAQTGISGPILVRAIDVVKGTPVVFVNQFAYGPVVGTDTLNGKTVQQHTELVLDTSHAQKNHLGHPYEWSFFAGVPNNQSFQSGWQIDGLGFSEIFLTCF
jgi:hypothetical protein